MIFTCALSLEPKYFCIRFSYCKCPTVIYKYLSSHGSHSPGPCFPLFLLSWFRLSPSHLGLCFFSLFLHDHWQLQLFEIHLNLSSRMSILLILFAFAVLFLSFLCFSASFVLSVLFLLLFLAVMSSKSLNYPHGGYFGYGYPLTLKTLSSFRGAGYLATTLPASILCGWYC